MDAKATPDALVWVVARVRQSEHVYAIGAKKDASYLYVRVVREDTAAVFAAEVLSVQRGAAAIDEFLRGIEACTIKLVLDSTSVAVRVNAVEVRTAFVPEGDFAVTPSGGVKCSAMQRRWEASHALQLALIRAVQPK